MIEWSIYRLLEYPRVYNICTYLLAPGSEKDLHDKIQLIISELPTANCLLDVGCGPSSWLWHENLHPVGLDISWSYTSAFLSHGELAVNASADRLPFSDGSFNGVWSIGLFHHVPDPVAKEAIGECMRVTAPGGYCVIFDSVIPEPLWSRPLPWAIRRMDRGRFVRSQEAIESLLIDRYKWRCERFSYSLYGLEGLFCIFIKKE